MKQKFLSLLPPLLNSPQMRRGAEKVVRNKAFLLALLALSLCLYGSVGHMNAPIALGQTAQKSAQESKPKQAAKQIKPGQPRSAAAEIRATLDAQVAAWNAGKLEEFMDGYWRSPDLTFFSGGRKLSGWDATIERYRKTYQAEGREMGKLVFSDLDIQQLGPNAALVRGRWELTMSDGKKPGGLYTLIFRRFKQRWKIVHDHTSSSQ
jgi:ketosteroid isomerase-like protein